MANLNVAVNRTLYSKVQNKYLFSILYQYDSFSVYSVLTNYCHVGWEKGGCQKIFFTVIYNDSVLFFVGRFRFSIFHFVLFRFDFVPHFTGTLAKHEPTYIYNMFVIYIVDNTSSIFDKKVC